MLFLPIDKDSLLPDASNTNSSFNKSNASKNQSQSRGQFNLSNFGQVKASIRRQNLQEITDEFKKQKQNLAMNTTTGSCNKASTTRREYKKQWIQNSKENIKKTTKDANCLIEYMRIINEAKQKQSQLQSSSQNSSTQLESNGVFSAYNQQTKKSPSRVMTSMSPSTKQKLRRDLQTFSRQYVTLEEQNPLLPRRPKSIMKLPLPQYTKHAYYQANEPEMQAIRQKTQLVNSKHQLPFNKSFEKIDLENMKKEFNDEIILFSNNASKPLVSQDRHYGKVHNHKLQQNNMRTNLPNTSSYISRDNNSVVRKRSTTPQRKEKRNVVQAPGGKRNLSHQNSKNVESVKKMLMKNKMQQLQREVQKECQQPQRDCEQGDQEGDSEESSNFQREDRRDRSLNKNVGGINGAKIYQSLNQTSQKLQREDDSHQQQTKQLYRALSFSNTFNSSKKSRSKNQDHQKMSSKQAYKTQQNMAQIKDIANEILVNRPKIIRNNNKQSLKTEPINNCPKSPYGHMEEPEKDPEILQESPFTVKLCMNCQRSVKFRKPHIQNGVHNGAGGVALQQQHQGHKQHKQQLQQQQQNHNTGSQQKMMIKSVAAVTKKRIQTAKAILGRTKDQLSSSAEQLIYVIESNSNNPAAMQKNNSNGAAGGNAALQEPNSSGNMIKIQSGTNTTNATNATTAGGGGGGGVGGVALSRNSMMRQIKTESTGMDMYTQSDAMIGNSNQRSKLSGHVVETDQRHKVATFPSRRKSSSQQRQQNYQPNHFNRPKTSLTNASKGAITQQQSKQKYGRVINSTTFNLMNSKAQEARELNGRSFIIYGKEEYDSYKDTHNQNGSMN